MKHESRSMNQEKKNKKQELLDSLFLIPDSDKKNGFTIIELLVVIAVFGIMAAVVFANYRESKISSRNADRLQAMRALQTALDLYHSSHVKYPGSIGSNGPVGTLLTSLVTEGFIPSLPVEPLDAASPYYYCPGDDSGFGPQGYLLRAKMEQEKGANPAALAGDLDGTVNGCDCSDANLYYCVTP